MLPSPESFAITIPELFFFLANVHLMEFPSQGSDLSHSQGNTGSLNPLCQAGDLTHVLALQRYHQSYGDTVGVASSLVLSPPLTPPPLDPGCCINHLLTAWASAGIHMSLTL